MFDKLFSALKAKPSQPDADIDEPALSVAALMVEAARADERYDEAEAKLIDRALASAFLLSGEAAAALRAKAETAQAGATDIQRFTKIAKTLDHDRKIKIVECMWEIILSDGERDPYEDALMRRICGLIYLDDQDSGAARQRVEARLQGN